MNKYTVRIITKSKDDIATVIEAISAENAIRLAREKFNVKEEVVTDVKVTLHSESGGW